MTKKQDLSFRAFTTKYDGLTKRIITNISICPAYDPNDIQAKSEIEYCETKGLWDTGATNSVITKNTAKILKLKSIGLAEIYHAGGKSLQNSYMVNIVLPNRVEMIGIKVLECSNIAGSFGAIIGMDVITNGDLSITKTDGKTVMSYRFPSVKRIDYVKEAITLKFTGVGRNQSCPCGSGKKYKNCCLEIVRETI